MLLVRAQWVRVFLAKFGEPKGALCIRDFHSIKNQIFYESDFLEKKQRKYFKAPTLFQIFKLTQTDSNSQQVTTVTSNRTTGTKNKMRERRDKKS